ncbi:histidine kinase [Balneolaceae bacterium YR4-1]|uniref:Histidine kinase n=1 Tax=Halalkalibaculum roseum TaxID=2709311 RepID=A0A6M1SQR5_9BACT|nr:sensor histidine kinase [Halalkalibaculum roseum]NGP75052.1 histidine kinase [Halalkalibaculum roseum]
MQITKVKITEWGVQLLAVLVFVLVAVDNYERSTRYIPEARSIGLLITTNINLIFWHIIIYGLWTLTWFLFYFGIYKRFEHSLKKKVLGGFAGWIIFSLTQMGLVFIITKLPSLQPNATDSILNFPVTYELGQTIFVIYFIIGVIAFMTQTAMQFLYRYRELEQADHMQSELALIRSQLRPHFFFNTLNNLYAMALETKNEALADGIQNLTGMMRYTLKHSTRDLVPLSDEWNYVSQYIELQKLRFDPEMVEITVQTSGNIEEARIAPMILINFVENAFKHGVSYEGKSIIMINLIVTNSSLALTVKNSNHPSDKDTGISGIGTVQTQKILSLYYDDDYDLDITSTKEWHKVVLKLPVR